MTRVGILTSLVLCLLAATLNVAACASSDQHASSHDAASAGSSAPDAALPGEHPASDASSGLDARVQTSDAAIAGGRDAAAIGGDAGSFDPLDPASHGATITFQSIGAAGWYPSRRDPASGPCDAYQSDSCCLAKHELSSDALTPWDEDLIMTLRGPMRVAQLVVYQPSNASDASSPWTRVSRWDAHAAQTPDGLAFDGNHTEDDGFAGDVGTECLVNVSTAAPFACGAGSSPFCDQGKRAFQGWKGSKLFVLLASMPHAGDVSNPCSQDDSGGWYDAPWIGLSVGELIRSGAFGSCQCYAKDMTKGYLADGCGQFNVFEVVNDKNQYKNLDVFSTNMIGYAGYVGEGPCGAQCDVSKLAPGVDLIDKQQDVEAAAGAISNPMQGPHAAFRRPVLGYRYFVILLDIHSRSVQLAIIHPSSIPASVSPVLPALPESLPAASLAALLALRLPH